MRYLPFLVFFSVVLGIDAGVHGYIFHRLFWAPEWPVAVQAAGGLFLGAMAILLPLSLLFSRRLPRSLGRPLAYLVYVWLGAVFYFVVVLFSLDVARFLISLIFDGWDRPVIARTSALVAGAGTAVLTAAAVRSGLADVQIEEVEVKLPRLPKALEGLTLVQLSDVHIGPTIGKGFVREIVHKTNRLKPDAVVITGDLVDGGVARLRDHAQPLADLAARYGVYFVTGNHDFYSGATAWISELERLGIRVLQNERIRLGEEGTSIDLAGVHDYASGASDVGAACEGRDEERELVLLAHQPKSMEAATPHRPGLVLAGHTHGGQLWPFDKVVRLAQPYVAGLYQHDDHSQIYVSRGTGYWGPPMRFLAPAEITRIVLV